MLSTLDVKNRSAHSEKCLKIHGLINSMTALMKGLRPTCDQILKDKSLWALSLIQLINDKNVKIDNETKLINESFHLFFIQTKLRYSKFNSNKVSTIGKTLNYFKNFFRNINK